MKYTPDFSSRFRILKGGKISLVVSALLGGSVIAHAAPSGGTLTSGSATISQSGTVTTIDQSTNKASINWQNFSIGSHETVNFNQPNVNSITLNRVIGTEKSVIDGALNANGQVWILNANGVLFGKNAAVNTSGILATTAELSDTDFQAGNYAFKNATSNAVVNLGTIEVPNSGSVVLASNEVINSGTIKAVHGKVHLVGANSYSLNLNGNSLVNLRVDTGVLDALVSNSGNILADGGEIYLTTNAVNELLKGVVNNTGLIEANSIDGISGYVELFAHGGTANISGNINGKDGFVETSGDTVKINDDFRVTADKWLIDPKDFTIAASGGDITGATLSSNLESASVEIQSVNGATDGNGDIFVNDAVSWNAATKLTLNAQNDIFINESISAANAGGQLALYYGQGAVNANNTSNYYVNAPINLKAGGNFFTKLGSNGILPTWKVITTLGSAGSLTATDLQGINGNLSGYYVLGANIDASATSTWNVGDHDGDTGEFTAEVPMGWTPLGNTTTQFRGNFDGLGHTVENLTINRPTENYIGLFGYTDGATIKNIGVTNVDITGDDMVGGLVGEIYSSTVSNAYSTGSVTAKTINSAYVGGLVGYNSTSSTVSNSYSTGSVTGVANANVGGLVGYSNFSTISNSYSTGSVTGGAGAKVGGLVGYNDVSTVSNSYSTGSVTGGADATLGGLVSINSEGTVNNSYYDKTINSVGMNDTTYGKTTTELQTPSTFSTWDNTIWSFSTGGGASVAGYEVGEASYPYLTKVTADADKPTGTNVILFSGGFGTSANPYTIINWTQLQNINNSNILTQNYYFSLLNDLSSTISDYTNLASSTANSGAGWNPIGDNTNKFTGTFDGANKTIDSLFINRPTGNYIGLFGYTNGANIKNIGVTNVDITGGDNSYAGGLVGYNKESSTVSNAYSTGSVTGGNGAYVGGLVGLNLYSTVSNSYSTVSVTGGNKYVGGLVGYNTNFSTISDSYSTGSVTVGEGANAYAGGLVGYNASSTVSNSYSASSSITGTYAGGLVGANASSTVDNSYYDKTLVAGMAGEATYGKTTTELRDLATQNWDDTIWTFVDGTQEGFGVYIRPYLKDVTTEADKPDTFTLFEDGFGTSDDAYEITNWTQLQNINNSNILTQNYYFSLLNNLSSTTSDYTDLASSTANSGAGWNPIGDNTDKFTGTFDGANKTIDSLFINRPTENYIGLFGFTNAATIKNIGVTNVDITGAGFFIGGLVGNTMNSSTISNAYTTGSVTGGDNSNVGGLVAALFDSSTISNSYSQASVTGGNGEETLVGGLVGYNKDYTTISNSYSTGSVTGGTGAYVGGLVGLNITSTTVTNSYFAGSVTGGTGATVGGLVGANIDSTVTNSYYDKETNTGTMSDSELGKTSAELQSLATFSDAGWDIEEDATVNKGTPFLAWQQSENGYTKTWVIGTKVASSGGGSTSGGSTASDIESIITPIVNNIVVPQIPTFDVKPMATAPQAQPIVMTSTGQTVNLLSQPLQNQNTTMVTMGELQANHDSNTPNPNSDIRVPVGDNSIIELVNGGVHLPDGVEQQFFVVADKTN
jgi:filamentous hemagglutinin family protein